jgi:hypothetical protein
MTPLMTFTRINREREETVTSNYIGSQNVQVIIVILLLDLRYCHSGEKRPRVLGEPTIFITPTRKRRIQHQMLLHLLHPPPHQRRIDLTQPLWEKKFAKVWRAQNNSAAPPKCLSIRKFMLPQQKQEKDMMLYYAAHFKD